MPLRRWVVLLFVVLSLAACERGGDAPAADAMTMRVYDVPPDRATALRDSLNEALGSKDQQNGKVSVGADGKLIVLAPERLQASIESSLKALAGDAEPTPDVARSIRLRLWTVDAVPGAGPDSRGLEEVQPAIEALRASAGDAGFQLRDQVDSVSMSGDEVQRNWYVQGQYGIRATQELVYRATRQAGGTMKIVFHLIDSLRAAGENSQPPSQGFRINSGVQVRTTVSIAAGQQLVLASQPMIGAGSDATSTRYYIVRIDDVGAD